MIAPYTASFSSFHSYNLHDLIDNSSAPSSENNIPSYKKPSLLPLAGLSATGLLIFLTFTCLNCQSLFFSSFLTSNHLSRKKCQGCSHCSFLSPNPDFPCEVLAFPTASFYLPGMAAFLLVCFWLWPEILSLGRRLARGNRSRRHRGGKLSAWKRARCGNE